MDFLRIKVQDWVEQGFANLIPTTPRFVNPLSVVSKLDQESGILKKRVILKKIQETSDRLILMY